MYKCVGFLRRVRGPCNGLSDGVEGLAMQFVQATESLSDTGEKGEAVVP